MDKRFMSRKFWMAAGCELIGTGLLIGKLITAEHWIALTQFLVAAYMAGNVGDTAAERMKP